MASPYANQPENKWPAITKKLIDKHPLKNVLVDLVLKSWKSIFKSNFDSFKIGTDFFPEPQIMGFFLHDLIALHLSKMNSDYRLGSATFEKDIECISNPEFSIEIKTSSNPNKIFGNRSYAVSSTTENKSKDGYFLAVNFEKFTPENNRPKILLIRFAYLEHSDWKAQNAQSGQQASLSKEVYNTKFVTLYDVKNHPNKSKDVSL